MCYQLSVRYGLPHGHAAALCNAVLFPHMLAHPELWIPRHGEVSMQLALNEIARSMGCQTPEQAAEKSSESGNRATFRCNNKALLV